MAKALRPGIVVIRGWRMVDRRLADLPIKVQRAIVRKGLRKAAQPVLQQARKRAPKDTGKLRRSIKLRSIFSLPGLRKMKRDRWLAGMSIFTSERDLRGGGQNAFYGRFQEFGTRRIRQKKFMRGAFDDQKHMVWGRLQKFIADAVIRVAQGGNP